MKDMQDSVWDNCSGPVRMGRGSGGGITRVMSGILAESTV